MEAARIPWRPLGRLLVEQGLLTADELEHALAEQERTGRRLGETLLECGFVSGPELSNALAAQYGIELIAETGFGTGLRTVIQRRHESDRGRIVRSVPSADEPEDLNEAEPSPERAEPETPSPDEQLLHAQLEEQWAKLAAAEERLAESHRELTSLARQYDRRRSQAERLAHRARRARERLAFQHEHAGRLEQLEKEVRSGEAEIERLRGESAGLRHALADTAEAVAVRDRQLGEQSTRLTAAEERLLESHRELAALAREYDQRRNQASRLARRSRHTRKQLTSLEELRGALTTLRGQLENTEADVAERDRLLGDMRRDAEHRRAQALRFLERVRKSTPSEQHRARLEAAEERIAESERELAALGREADERRSQAARLARRARHARWKLPSQDERDERIERLEGDVLGCDTEIERLRNESTSLRDALADAEATVAERDRLLEGLRREAERRRAQTVRLLERANDSMPRVTRTEVPIDSHLAFVHLAGRYELVERAGPPPARNTLLELPELFSGALVVAGLGRSPLPGDTRPCAFVQPAR